MVETVHISMDFLGKVLHPPLSAWMRVRSHVWSMLPW